MPAYAKSLISDGLKGARIGVLRQAYETPTTDPEIVSVFTKALEDLQSGRRRPSSIRSRSSCRRARAAAGPCRGFKFDINEYLAARGQKAPVHTLDEILASPLMAQLPESVQQRLRQSAKATPQGPESDACKADAAYREAFGAAVTASMDAAQARRLRLSDLEQPAAH